MVQLHLCTIRLFRIVIQSICVFLTGAFFSASPGAAASDDVCHVYAQSAVGQNSENLRLGCGLSGPRWQAQEGGHFLFCKSTNVELLESETATRAEELAVCSQNANAQGRAPGQGAPARPGGPYESVYSQLNLGQCQQEAPDPNDPLSGGVWWCVGYDGIPVRVAEGDLRFLVSFGVNAAAEPAAGQTLPQFNRIGTTLEWRLEWHAVDRLWVPVATVLRYFTERELAAEGQVLVVTKLGPPGEVCHIGYVDALLNPNANVIARQIAETQASSFVCGRDGAGYHGIAPP